MVIDYFVMLGKGCPEKMKDGRVSVCSAGWAEDLDSLIRIYPLSKINPPKRWGLYSIALERNPKDVRRESFRISGNRTPRWFDSINGKFEFRRFCTDEEKKSILTQSTYPKCKHKNSINYLNDRYMSLGIIWPKEPPELFFDEKGIPRLKVVDDDPPKTNGYRNMQIREWGVWEYMRKTGKKVTTKQLGLDTCPPLLVGNLNTHKNVWLVITIFRGYDKYFNKNLEQELF